MTDPLTASRDRSTEPIEQFTIADIHPSDFVSANFQVHKLLKSETAVRCGIVNVFESDKQLRSAIHLCRKILQPLHTLYGPFSPNSVFRNQAVERAMKNKPSSWTSTSQHTLGEAGDIEHSRMSNLALATWIRDHYEFDQLILECYTPSIPASGWVHVSLKRFGPNKQQVLSYIKDGSAWKYVDGFAV